jgi:hypothetical protein
VEAGRGDGLPLTAPANVLPLAAPANVHIVTR